MKEAEIRKHYFLDQYVIIAPKRNSRPKRTACAVEGEPKDCYFCSPQVDDPKKQIQIKNYNFGEKSWQIKVIGNLYPALTTENPKSFGKQEIIIETDEHRKEIHEFSISHIKRVLDVYSDRYKILTEMPGVRHVVVFKNEGGKAGASIPHAHTQIYALPMVPPKINRESESMDRYFQEKGTCPYCDILKAEAGGPRVIWEDKHLMALSPYASTSPYGVWLIPKRHINTMLDLNESEKTSIAKALKATLSKLEEISVSFNYFFVNSLEKKDHHMVLKIAPRPNVWGGLELDTGIIVNPVPPEEAVKFYRGK